MKEGDSNKVLENLIEIEKKAEEVLAERQNIVDLDRRRQKTREALRAISKDTISKKAWLCFGNMFLKVPKNQATMLLKSDYDKIEEEINTSRDKLKPKVAQLRDLEYKDDLKGYNLQALSQEEVQAMQQIL